MQTSSKRNKRTFPRKVFYREVSATSTLGETRQLLSINCSNSGIGLVSFKPIAVGEVFDLEFNMQDNNISSKHKLSAEVVQRYNVSEIYFLGLRFEKEININGENQAY